MELKQKKTKIFALCKKKKAKRMNIKSISNIGIEIVDSYKYLGLHIDSSLTLDNYINQLIGKVKQFHLSIPKMLINSVSLKTRLELWKVYCNSHLAYGCGILFTTPSKMKKYEKIYMKTLKNACKLHKNTESVQVIKALEVWSPKI